MKNKSIVFKIIFLLTFLCLCFALYSCSNNEYIVNTSINEQANTNEMSLIETIVESITENAKEEPEDNKDYESSNEESKTEETKVSKSLNNSEKTTLSTNSEVSKSETNVSKESKNQTNKSASAGKSKNKNGDSVHTYSLYDCTGAVDENVEIALIFEGVQIEDAMYNRDAFDGLLAYAEENNKTCGYYKVLSFSDRRYDDAIDAAISNHAKVIITLGEGFKHSVEKFQINHPDIVFILIDTAPVAEDGTDDIKQNTLSIEFNEELAGFMAGYAMVAEGFRHFGFVGGEPVEAVKDYGYGFAQGISYASKRQGSTSTLSYTYANTFEDVDEVIDLSNRWYKNGCEVIFSCGGAISNSVVASANRVKWYVIGVDADQSSDSSSFFTSAKKLVGKAISDSLKTIYEDNFDLTNARKIDFRNKYVDLEFDNGQFEIFKKNNLNSLKTKLLSGEIKVNKSTDGKQDLSDIDLQNVDFSYIDFDEFVESLEE